MEAKLHPDTDLPEPPALAGNVRQLENVCRWLTNDGLGPGGTGRRSAHRAADLRSAHRRRASQLPVAGKQLQDWVAAKLARVRPISPDAMPQF